jgi:2-octaprenyl-3-methyl-6-methoxy-1,4-benzoquinol hydroxylase
MVENNVLQQALWQALEAHEGDAARSASLKAMHPRGRYLTLDNGDELAVKLVIGADGANSQVRQMAGIGVHAWQYQQSCMLITVECENAPGESTWQQFTPNGPRAFCRCSTTGHRWCGTTNRRVFASCRDEHGAAAAGDYAHFPAVWGR